MGEIEAALAAFDDRSAHFDPADIAIAGVFGSIDADGSLSVDRGFVRPEDMPHVRTDGGEGSETDTEFVGPASPSVQRAVITIGGQPVEPEEDDEDDGIKPLRSEEHTSELRSLMRISYAVFCLKKKKKKKKKQ